MNLINCIEFLNKNLENLKVLTNWIKMIKVGKKDSNKLKF